MLTTAETLAAFLAAQGIRRLYGLPGGGSSLDVIEACRRHRIDFVSTHRGEAAAFMAATEGDLLGRPGVCLTGLGPGAVAAQAGVAHAQAARCPLVVISERASRSGLHLSAHQALDHLRLFEPLAKAGATLTAHRAGRLLAWAWRRALDLPSGPIHLDLPWDEAGRPVRGGALPPRVKSPSTPSPNAVRSAARLLARRGRIIAIAGQACREAKTARALQELVEHLGCPVLATPRAKGVIPEDHPLVAGVYVGGRLEEELLAKAEGVLAVGLDAVELLPRRWRAALPVISLAAYRSRPVPYELAAEIVADLPTTLGAFREALPPGGGWGLAEWARRGATFRLRTREVLVEASEGRGGGGIPPHRVVEIARAVFPRDALVSADSGVHAAVLSAFWESYEPKGYLCSGGLAAMGSALPAAMVAKLTFPARPVLAVLGDGGFCLSLPDVLTAARLGVGLTVLVFVDEWLGLTRALQERRHYAPVGTSLGSPDIPALAESLGALGTVVEDEEGLRAALQDAVCTPQPAIIAARVRASGYRRLLETLHGPIDG